ncbi:MAG: peroxiredoxin [Sphingomonadaceae bacterium]
MAKRILIYAAVLVLAMMGGQQVKAELPAGTRAPDFSTQAALAGKSYGFSLRSALAKGPVVLYFYPKAFTRGCTLEANAFAQASDDFRAAGATVIGMSNDDIETLKRFSREHCRDKFAVASASPAVIRSYDVALSRDGKNTGLSSRTSYVIGRDGVIRFVHSDMDYRDHVRLTLNAVRALDKRQKSR